MFWTTRAAAFCDKLIFKFQQSESTGRFERLREVQELQADLTKHVGIFRDLHQGRGRSA